ncbi:MAG: effector binding domain-containing protein [Ruminiclostridium sp.]|nr:effector binding domain-containing protein [Ruminiclostridium sp.]
MNDMTVSEVSRDFGVSTRMLRYYEQEGLISSKRRDDYAYRIYDETAVRRLRQILLLRKLRIPLKQIAVILNSADRSETVSILIDKIKELEEEISSLKIIRDILSEIVVKGEGVIDKLLDDKLSVIVRAIPSSNNNLEENTVMSENQTNKLEQLEKANQTVDEISSDIRIIRLPPFTVASNHYIGRDPEDVVDKPVDKFIRESGLYNIKPDARYFGFNHPNPGILEEGIHGYEVWVTIPDDMEVPEPLTKKKFPGGLYAVMTIRFPEFQRWGDLARWAETYGIYEPDYSPLGLEIMGGCLEEHLNWVYASHLGWPDDGITGQLDLMLPIKKRGE